MNEGLPVRLVSRLTTELALMSTRELLHLAPRKLETGIVAMALLRGALPNLVGDDALVFPETRPLVGSISSVARSFNRSPETIRRHVHLLARQGLFTVDAEGVRLHVTSAARERLRAFVRFLHDGLLWLVGELHGWGVVNAPVGRTPRKVPLGTILRTSLDLRLVGFETFRSPIGDWTSLVVWNALSALSVRHITTSRALSGQFMERSTPDTLRRPTTVLALCGVTGLPYATVWRHMAALEKAGRVGRSGKNYIMRTEQLLTAAVEDSVTAYVRDVLNRVERLFAEGLDTNAIPSLFLGPNPEVVTVP